MVFSGQLTEDIVFYQIVETQSASGYKSTEEQEILKCRAERLKNKENLVVDGNEIFHVVELTFRMRNRKEVKETNIVKYIGERYRIISLDRYPRDNEMVIIISKINE